MWKWLWPWIVCCAASRPVHRHCFQEPLCSYRWLGPWVTTAIRSLGIRRLAWTSLRVTRVPAGTANCCKSTFRFLRSIRADSNNVGQVHLEMPAN